MTIVRPERKLREVEGLRLPVQHSVARRQLQVRKIAERGRGNGNAFRIELPCIAVVGRFNRGYRSGRRFHPFRTDGNRRLIDRVRWLIDRQSSVSGKSVSVREDSGGGRSI